MVTRIHKSAPRRLFLREHRKAKGLSAPTVAGRMGIERESLYRIERKRSVKSETLRAYAAAIDEPVEALWRLPGGPPSLDEIVAQASDEVKIMAADIVRRIVGARR